MLDAASYAGLRAQEQLRQNGQSAPIRWVEFLDHLSRHFTGEGVERFSATKFVRSSQPAMMWHFSSDAIAASTCSRRLAYLSWGTSHLMGVRRLVGHFVLRRSARVYVNDEVTAREVQSITCNPAKLVPYFVDADFFGFRPIKGRGSFLFCPGSNDRDPKLLLGLAQAGHQVCWLVNDNELIEKYREAHKNLVLVSNVSFEELRTLYQTCAACILPTVRDIHAAGQTTGLEALLCGAPLLISQGRTAMIFQQLPSVSVVEESTSERWSEAVSPLIGYPDLPSATRESSRRLATAMELPALFDRFSDIF